VVDAKDLYGELTSVWDANPFGLDLKPARPHVVNTWRKARMKPEQLLVEPSPWVTLNYETLTSADCSGEVSWNVERSGTAYGLCVWFDTQLCEGVCFSNAPGSPELIYGSAFFPWSEPVDLLPGDIVTVFLQAKFVVEDYIWGWNTRVLTGGDPTRIKADFRQSTFYGTPLSPARLRKQAHDHVPSLNDDGRIDRFILEQMDGIVPLDRIAHQLVDLFPSRFSNWKDALTRIGDLSQKYGQ